MTTRSRLCTANWRNAPLDAEDTGVTARSERYDETNPDAAPEDRGKYAAWLDERRRRTLSGRPDIAGFSAAAIFLADRVDELKSAYERINPGHGDLPSICFETVPGGGLDAYTVRTACAEQFAVIVPDGFFALANLFTKLVIRLQPITATATESVYLRSASFEQLSLSKSPT